MLAGKIVGKVLRKKMGNVPDEVLDIVQAVTDEDVTEAVKDDPALKAEMVEFSQSQLDFYGRFEDLPMFAQTMRALMRPILTLIFCLPFSLVICYMMIVGLLAPSEGLAYLGGPVGLVVGFLFGEKRDTKSG